ncbi:MAG: molybdate ABC transporter substrate-binding protein, partial [Myxococcota bacterium]
MLSNDWAPVLLWCAWGWCGVACVVSAGCSRSAPSSALHVYAASSLTEAFREMEVVFEAAHPGTDVVLNLAGSQVLRLQIEQGARADLFASANAEHMQALIDGGYVADRRTLATN